MSSVINPELAPILPLSPEHVVENLEYLEKSSDGMLNLILASRDPEGEGPTSGFYSSLPVGELNKWHAEQGDHEEGVSDLYKIGLIYGTDMALSAAKFTDLEELPEPELNKFDLDKAIEYLKGSYDKNQYLESLPWKRERYRELEYAGSDILSLANAGLYNAVKKKLEERELDSYNNQTAQLTGLIDGVILVDAYRRITKGNEPRPFDTSPLNKSIYSSEWINPGFEELRSLAEVLDLVKDNEPRRFVVPVADGARLITVATTRQVGANLFYRGLEDEKIIAPKYISKMFGVYGATGITIDIANYFISRLDGEVSGVTHAPVSTLLSLAIYGVIYNIKKKLASDEAIKRGVPMISPSEYKRDYLKN